MKLSPAQSRKEAIEIARISKACKEARAKGIRDSMAVVQRWVFERVGEEGEDWGTGKRKAILELEKLLEETENK